jgi:hypothetical protein
MSESKKNEPKENLMNRFRAIFGFQDPHNKNALPPKAHFSIWYSLIAVLAFSYMQQYFFIDELDALGKARGMNAMGGMTNASRR